MDQFKHRESDYTTFTEEQNTGEKLQPAPKNASVVIDKSNKNTLIAPPEMNSDGQVGLKRSFDQIFKPTTSQSQVLPLRPSVATSSILVNPKL